MEGPTTSQDADINSAAQDAEIVEEHLHKPEVWIPDDITTAFTLTSAGANTYGAWVQILASTPATFMDLHRFIVVNPLVNALPGDGVYDIQLGVGAGGAQAAITHTRLYIDATGANLPRGPVIIQCPRDKIPTGTRLWARIKTNLGSTHKLDLQFGYHVYDTSV